MIGKRIAAPGPRALVPRALGTCVLGTFALGLLAMPALGQNPRGHDRGLAMLDQIERGAWELRDHGEPRAARKICLRDARQLIQLRHPGEPCKSVVVEDTPNEVTVQYTCAGRGYGRTHIRRETDRLLQIDSQGIVNGRPFAFALEGRRVGTCGG